MPLTIISAIARSGADPWMEAARIAKLPRPAALDVLARMIPERSGAEKADIANRLVALLPISRESRRSVQVARSNALASSWNPVVPVVLALLLGLAFVVYFKKAQHSGEDLLAPSSLPAISDKADQQERN